MFDVSRLFIIFKISYLFSFFYNHKGVARRARGQVHAKRLF